MTNHTWSGAFSMKIPAGKIQLSCILGAFCLTLSACSGGLVRGEPPLVGVSTLHVGQDALQTSVDIYNPNDVEMPVSVIR